jgi:hypothetical protein
VSWRLILLLVIVAVIGLEWLRLSSPTSVRLRETFDFDTPAGPRTATTVVDVVQHPSIPYLPGGSIGDMNTLGDAATLKLDGVQVFLPRGDRWLHQMATRYGMIEPKVEIDDIRPGVSNSREFLRRMDRKRATLTLNMNALRPDLRHGINVVETSDPDGENSFSDTLLGEFEARHPGIKLRRVTFSVTDDPVSRHLDQLLPWLNDPAAVQRAGLTNFSFRLRDWQYAKAQQTKQAGPDKR